jgi:hypothetical protein
MESIFTARMEEQGQREARSKAGQGPPAHNNGAENVGNSSWGREAVKTWPASESLQEILLFCGASGRFLAPNSSTCVVGIPSGTRRQGRIGKLCLPVSGPSSQSTI